jgi:3-hydroxyisobutyrate dehydrogenase-like beta-hydroxyacid dehydrogenase
MSDVTVIGLGPMGSALARTFVRAGKNVSVWNRTAERAEPLERMGAVRAPSLAEAVRASPVLVICLSDYAATAALLADQGVTAVIGGRLLVQLSSGTSNDARALGGWAAKHRAGYLDGAISAWPSQIGTPAAGILVAGAEAVLVSARPLLQLLGGLSYAGPDIGHAKALFSAALAYFTGHWIGFSHGAAICEAEGLDPNHFGSMMADLSPMFAQDMRHMGQVIAEGRYGGPESTLESVGGHIARLAELSRDIDIDTAFPRFAADIFQRAVVAGYGAEEHCALIKVFRRAPG